MAQVQIAHPGKRVVYFGTKDKKGRAVFERYEMADVDAIDAVTRFPNDYSFDPPDGDAKIDNKVAPDPLVAGEQTPPDLVALEKDVAEADAAVVTADEAATKAKTGADPKSIAETAAALDAAKERAATARAKLDAAKNG